MNDQSNISVAVALITTLLAFAAASPLNGQAVPTTKDIILRFLSVCAIGVTVVGMLGTMDSKYLAEDMGAARHIPFLVVSLIVTIALCATTYLNTKSERRNWIGRYGH